MWPLWHVIEIILWIWNSLTQTFAIWQNNFASWELMQWFSWFILLEQAYVEESSNSNVGVDKFIIDNAMILLVLLIQNQQMRGQAQESQVRIKAGREMQSKKLTQIVILIILLALILKILIYFSATTHNKIPKRNFQIMFSLQKTGQTVSGWHIVKNLSPCIVHCVSCLPSLMIMHLWEKEAWRQRSTGK